MTAQLSGRATRTLITSMEVLSDDEKQVLMLDRQEDGSIIIKTRAPHESPYYSDGPRWEVKAKDARILGALLRSEDQQYSETMLKEISSSKVTRDKPPEVIEKELREKIGDCSELDIERAKAANLVEEKANLLLGLERDHALDKHITADVPGCPACERKTNPMADYISRTHIEEEATDASDDAPADNTEVPW